MDRITDKHLQELAHRINTELHRPTEYWKKLVPTAAGSAQFSTAGM